MVWLMMDIVAANRGRGAALWLAARATVNPLEAAVAAPVNVTVDNASSTVSGRGM